MPLTNSRDVLHEKTFRAWINKYLVYKDTSINDLTTDLYDGTKLVLLVELLSRKAISNKTFKQPTTDIHRIANSATALQTLKTTRWPELDIDAKQILACDAKIILGMVSRTVIISCLF